MKTKLKQFVISNSLFRFPNSNQKTVMSVLLLCGLMIFQTFTTTASASDFFSLVEEFTLFSEKESEFVKDKDDSKYGAKIGGSQGQNLLDYTINVDEVENFHYYRLHPSDSTEESCNVSVAGNNAALSRDPTGPFLSTVFVTFTNDNTGELGFGRTPEIYIKGIAPASNVAVTLNCPITDAAVDYWNVVPASNLNVGFHGLTTMGVGEKRDAYAYVTNGPPNTTGNIVIRTENIGSGTDNPKYVGFTPRNSTLPLTSLISLPVTLDEIGTGYVFYSIKGLEASTTSKPIYAQFNPTNGSTIAGGTSVNVIGIESITIERDAGQVPIDNNPHLGGGLRVFPEKKTPTDSSFGRNKVTVKVRLTEPRNFVKINYKIFDMDDPEIVLNTFDAGGFTAVDSNGLQGNDNRGSTSLYPIGGTNGYTNNQGIASMPVQISPQPGDNIRIAASIVVDETEGENNYLDELQLSSVFIATVEGIDLYANTDLKDSDDNILTSTNTGTPRIAGATTPLLTTWRKLHLEVDSMGTVTNNSLIGAITDTTPDTAFTTKLTTNRAMEAGGFANGRIEITTNGVTKSYKTLNSIGNTVMVQAVLNDTLIGSIFKMFDDDDMNASGTKPDGDNGEDIPSPELGFLQNSDDFTANVLANVYIRPTYDLTGNQTNLHFYLNTPKANLSASDATLAEYDVMTGFNNEATRKDKEFWTGYILGAYQNFAQGDFDPDTDARTNGVVSNITRTASSLGSICFLEAVSENSNHKNLQLGNTGYDLFKDWRTPPLNMVLQQLRVQKGDGGWIDNQFGFFTGVSQNKIRNSLIPLMADAP